jgi:hypothetical protein
MCHYFRLLFPAIVLLLLSLWSLQSFAADHRQCVAVHFAKGATSTVVQGNVSAEQVDCFTFGAGQNQYAEVSVKARNVSVSVVGVGSGDRWSALDFITIAKEYKVIVSRTKTSSVDSYAITLSIIDAKNIEPLNGNWEFVYPCPEGIYTDRCKAGESDLFSLTINQFDQRVCGSYTLTGGLGNHVDDGELKDWSFKRTSRQTYHIHYHISGKVGEATVFLREGKMYWNRQSEQNHAEEQQLMWSLSTPAFATLIRKSRNISSLGPC